MRLRAFVRLVPVTALSGLLVIAAAMQVHSEQASVIYQPSDAEKGIDLQTNTDNIILCTDNGSTRTYPITTGTLSSDTTTRFWVYEFTNDQNANNGAYYLSPAEHAADPGMGAGNPVLTQMQRGKTYIVYTDQPLHFRCGVGLSKVGDAGTGGANGSNASTTGGTACRQITCTYTLNPGCSYVPGQDGNGCPACGSVSCPNGSAASAPSSDFTLSPAQGPAGTTVTIQGNGFSLDAQNQISAGTSQSIVASPDGKSVTFTIPANAQPGPLTVEFYAAASQKFGEATFTVIGGVAPVITSLSPDSGVIGTQVTINGSGFAPTGNIIVYGNVQINDVTSSDGTHMTFTVPLDEGGIFDPGTHTMYVIVHNQNSNELNFNVTGQAGTSGSSSAPLAIDSLSPTSGPVGTTVTITGQGFAPTGNIIKFGNQQINNVSSTDGTHISFAVPFDMGGTVIPGEHGVCVDQIGQSSNCVDFNVTGDNSSEGNSASAGGQGTITLSAVYPSGGVQGSQVTITGTGFDPSAGSYTVYFGTFAVGQAIVQSATQLSFNVPYVPAGSYALYIATGGGTKSNPLHFTVEKQIITETSSEASSGSQCKQLYCVPNPPAPSGCTYQNQTDANGCQLNCPVLNCPSSAGSTGSNGSQGSTASVMPVALSTAIVSEPQYAQFKKGNTASFTVSLTDTQGSTGTAYIGLFPFGPGAGADRTLVFDSALSDLHCRPMRTTPDANGNYDPIYSPSDTHSAAAFCALGTMMTPGQTITVKIVYDVDQDMAPLCDPAGSPPDLGLTTVVQAGSMEAHANASAQLGPVPICSSQSSSEGNNCTLPADYVANATMYGTRFYRQQTSDNSYVVYTATDPDKTDDQIYLKGFDKNTCTTTTLDKNPYLDCIQTQTCTNQTYKGLGFDEPSISDDGKILDVQYQKDAPTHTQKIFHSIYIVDKTGKKLATIAQGVGVISNQIAPFPLVKYSDTDAMISKDGKRVVFEAETTNTLDTVNPQPWTLPGGPQVYVWQDGKITQISQYKPNSSNFGSADWTWDARFEDNAGRFISINLGFDPQTGQPFPPYLPGGPSTFWVPVYKLYLYDSKTGLWYKISDDTNPASRFAYQSQINAKIASLGGTTSDGQSSSSSSQIAFTLMCTDSVVTGNMPYGVASADLNGDGFRDIVVTNRTDNTISVFMSNGNGTFKPKVDYAVGQFPAAVKIADMNGDTKADVVVANLEDSTITILYNDGHGNFNRRYTISEPKNSFPNDVDVGDFDHDTKLDIAIANRADGNTQQTGGNIAVYLQNGDGFVLKETYPDNLASSIRVIDLNFDGKWDMVAGQPGTPAKIFMNNGDATFTEKTATTSQFGSDTFALGDINGDGFFDLVSAQNGGGALSILLNDKNGNLQSQPLWYVLVPNILTSLATGDVNGDGKADIIAGSQLQDGTNEITVFLNTTNAGASAPSFKQSAQYITDGKPVSILFTDVTGDGKSDIVVVNGDKNSVAIFSPQTDGSYSCMLGGNQNTSASASSQTGNQPLSCNTDSDCPDKVCNSCDQFQSCVPICVTYTCDSHICTEHFTSQ